MFCAEYNFYLFVKNNLVKVAVCIEHNDHNYSLKSDALKYKTNYTNNNTDKFIIAICKTKQ